MRIIKTKNDKLLVVDKYNDNLGLIYLSPTSNCQLMSIANFHIIITRYRTIDESCFIQNLKELIDEIINNKIKREIILIDIEESFFNRYIFFFNVDELFIIKQKYKSTNSSDMVLCLINTNRLIEFLNKNIKL